MLEPPAEAIPSVPSMEELDAYAHQQWEVWQRGVNAGGCFVFVCRGGRECSLAASCLPKALRWCAGSRE